MTGKYRGYIEYKVASVNWLETIPAHWIETSLKRYCRVTDGSHHSPKIQNSGMPFVSVTDVGVNYINFEDSKKITHEDYLRLAQDGCKPSVGDVLLTKDGTIGRAAIVIEEFPDFVILSSLGLLTPNKKLSNVFLYYYLVSGINIDQMNSIIHGSALKRMTISKIDNLLITIPPHDEQQKITNFLDHETAKIDTLIDKQQQLITLLKEKRQAVISHAVTKGLNPKAPMRDSGVEWLGEVPAHWDVARIKDLALIISKGTTPSTIGGDFVDEGVRFLKGENIGKSISTKKLPEFFITEAVDEQISRSRLEENDVLVIIAGATTGMASILQKDLLPANTNQAVSFIRPKEDSYSKLIVRWLSTEFAQRIIWMGAVQAAQPNLSMEDLGNIPIAVAPAKELIKIIEEVDRRLVKFDELNSKAKSAIELMQERRTALISAAVTGKIDVRNWQAPEPSNTNNKGVAA
jgi:type I restriction enzyme S subunit